MTPRVTVVAMLALAACAGRARTAVPPPAPALDATDGLQVVLTWETPVDLDLYVTDPSWETVYFANNPTRSGARLVRDERCESRGGEAAKIEVVRIASPLPGSYRIGVDFIDTCGDSRDRASFRVVAALADGTREVTGSATFNVFQPIVMELKVERDADGSAMIR